MYVLPGDKVEMFDELLFAIIGVRAAMCLVRRRG
jgi:hypothetical protein